MRKIKKIATLTCAMILSFVLCSTVQAMNETEENDTLDKAENITLGITMDGEIKDETDVDIFKCILTQSGRVTLNITAYMEFYSISIMDSSGNEVWYTHYNQWVMSEGYQKDVYSIDLEKGNYYIKVSGGISYNASYNDGIGSYSLQTSFVESGANIAEPNNSFSQAKDITIGKEVKGQIASNDWHDIYQLKVSNNPISIQMTSYMNFYSITIYDKIGKIVWYTDYNKWDESVKKRVDVHYPDLAEGTYYIKISGNIWHEYKGSPHSTGNYSFKIANTARKLTVNKKLKLELKQKKKLSATVTPAGTGEKIIYSIEDKKIATVDSSGVVTGKKAGHTKLTVKVGNNITAECDVLVCPATTKIQKLYSTAENNKKGTKCHYIYVQCKKVKNVDYQIYYSKKKNGKYKELTSISCNKKSIAVKKKGTYFIKVRTKMYSDGWYLYSDWTSPKQVKVK